MEIKRITKKEMTLTFASHGEARRVALTAEIAAKKLIEQDIMIRRMAKTIEDLVASLAKMKEHTFRFFPMPFGCKKAFLTSPMFLDTEEAGKLLAEFENGEEKIEYAPPPDDEF